MKRFADFIFFDLDCQQNSFFFDFSTIFFYILDLLFLGNFPELLIYLNISTNHQNLISLRALLMASLKRRVAGESTQSIQLIELSQSLPRPGHTVGRYCCGQQQRGVVASPVAMLITR